MVNTEHIDAFCLYADNYNILNIVVNTELNINTNVDDLDYNILNIVVNTERTIRFSKHFPNYNILNIVVNTEQGRLRC